MVDFRRVITALAVLALFTGLASADVIGGQGQLTCSTNVTVTPQLRGEGFTEQTGDITITCTGGTAPAVGSPVGLVNFTIFYNTLVTSRLFSTSTNASEALLLIDEPGSGLQGDGPNTPQKLCTTPTTGCTAAVATTGGIPYSAVSATDPTRAANVYQGIVSGNSVTFFGVPVLAPTTTGARVFRITNVRVNAQPLSGGSSSGGSPVQASISTSPSGALSISNSTPNVGFVSPSLTVSNDSLDPMKQCVSVTRTTVSTLTFKENFGTAFKTRLNPRLDEKYNAQLGLVVPGSTINATSQSTPGAIYNSESNFVFPIGSGYAGLTGFGTRLKATFNNVPAGARIFVSIANVNNATSAATPPTTIGGTSTTSYAQLVTSETVLDSLGASGTLPSLDTSTTSNSPLGDNTIREVSLSNGTGTAVWEVLNTNPNSNESFKFGVYLTYVSNTASNSPLPGDTTVAMSYAPTATSAAATNSDVYPRFAPSTTTPKLFSIGVCRTILLYPYVTNQAGFDTGLTVANTTQDPFTTGAQNGSCKLNWYGGTTSAPTTPPGPSDTGNIAAGTVWANTVQTIAPGFQGYMIAVCNFQYAHGFAFISDVGARNLAMGYLAVVLNDPRANANTTSNENGAH